ncbi:MAG: NADP-dependent oxidoreductase [Telmatospirillum sp.]|nr:NADP-dependent oxidoreductase [Telmatospirillum sp.]
MPQSPTVNRQITLASRPTGAPKPADFRIVDAPVPEPADGQVLLRTLFLSLDPYMRGRMSAARSYAAPVEVGAVMVGGTVSRIEKSRNAAFREGDLVVAYSGWQDFALSDGSDLQPLPRAAASHPSLALGVLGMPGFTAYMGLLDIGQPKAGETVVVAAATGPVGATVGQIARIKGSRAIGVAGGADKCRFAVQELGFDLCLDHRAPDFARQLEQACPNGIDVYFENVGGAVFDAVLPLLNTKARIPLCGLVSQYNAEHLPPGPNRLPLLAATLLSRRIRMEGFIIMQDYGHRIGEFTAQMGQWVGDGKVKYREDVVDGLENAPDAFIGLLAGQNFGKLVIRVADK